ncbi:unnamed protein product [Fusarium venenatum]|uniref:Uncharacterized protein n=1 Tax=Fusarium venenatum TaxID=56646 RepID=A0A2L2TG51_9HYPO|nr:uncharacterized protein FVRRES_09026 [Fusarium venenatum]CEI68949.1 unnamed protein product [Fusarium venenatum]
MTSLQLGENYIVSAVLRSTGDFTGRYGVVRALASAPLSCRSPVFAPYASDLPPGLDRACHATNSGSDASGKMERIKLVFVSVAGRRNSAKGFEMWTNSQKQVPEDLFKDMFASVAPSRVAAPRTHKGRRTVPLLHAIPDVT